MVADGKVKSHGILVSIQCKNLLSKVNITSSTSDIEMVLNYLEVRHPKL